MATLAQVPEGTSFLLSMVWIGLLAFGVFAYVVMDGFDLGVGVLFQRLNPGVERDTAMNTIAPVWDGNETWLVLGGGGLFAAFPLAYSIMMPALYTPIIAMLLGLVFRGVAFEFRWRDAGHRRYWDFAFAGGSVIAAFAQGITLGALLQGVQVEGRHYAGGWWDWLTPFTLLTGFSVVCGYGLLGATWLVMKTEHGLQDKARRIAQSLGAITVLALGAVSIVTPFLNEAYLQRWFAMPNVLYTAQVPLLTLIVTIALFRSLHKRREYLPFLMALALFGLSFIGLCISMFPYVIPHAVTIWDAAAPRSSQLFMLVGALVLIPIILIYTGYSYWVFRGKTRSEGYH